MNERGAHMVKTQLVERGITDTRVLSTMGSLRRERFVPREATKAAYDDRPLPIGDGQTISQPYIVAFMTEALQLTGVERVLEVGTGSGYQTAVLAELAGEVYSLEIRQHLAATARRTLDDLGYGNVHLRVGNGGDGWPEHAPFDRVLVTAAPTEVPPTLMEQCLEGGRIVLPLGDATQRIVVIDKTSAGVHRHMSIPVRFVPMLPDR